MRKNKVRTRRETSSRFRPTKPALLTLAIAQALAFQAAQAASIEVTSNLDDGTDCTLREALATVNTGADLLNGCVLTGDALGTNDTITFGPAVSGQTITTTQGELQITKNVSINPGGVNTTIDANQDTRVISVISNDAADLSVTLNQLTITEGNGSGIFVDNTYSGPYEYNTVSLTLTNSTVSGNTGNGISASVGFDEYANLVLTNCTVSDNTGDGIGVSANTGSSSINLANSTVSGNYGKGISGYHNADAYLTNSTVSGNTGGGMYLLYGFASLDNSTVSGNSGGGVSAGGNDAGIGLVNSIVANNGYGDCEASDNYGNSAIGAGPDTISTTVCGGATIADPLLGPLADNGGPTQTHALLAGSPAIDNATGAGATATDQRGVAAVGVRDSGAYEFTGNIETMGRPSIDRSADTGIFIWENEPNNWVAHVVSGDMPRIVDIDVLSTQALNNVQQVNIEANDVFTVLPNGLELSLNVNAPWLDGVSFTVQDQSSTCISTTNTDVPIYVGPNRVEVGRNIDLKTLAPCDSGPDIETVGRPDIDGSTDTGIFVWENEANNWVSHVVSGDMQRIIEVDVNSSDSISNAQEINIEASDVFTVLPNGLDLSLNVKAPWLDGFKFTEQAQANTCVSTTNTDVPIFVGPNRVEVGNNIDLKTLAPCDSGPDIETVGRPDIDGSTDTGIFVWENQAEQLGITRGFG